MLACPPAAVPEQGWKPFPGPPSTSGIIEKFNDPIMENTPCPEGVKVSVAIPAACCCGGRLGLSVWTTPVKPPAYLLAGVGGEVNSAKVPMPLLGPFNIVHVPSNAVLL